MITDLLDSVTVFDIVEETFFSDTVAVLIFLNPSIMRGT